MSRKSRAARKERKEREASRAAAVRASQAPGVAEAPTPAPDRPEESAGAASVPAPTAVVPPPDPPPAPTRREEPPTRRIERGPKSRTPEVQGGRRTRPPAEKKKTEAPAKKNPSAPPAVAAEPPPPAPPPRPAPPLPAPPPRPAPPPAPPRAAPPPPRPTPPPVEESGTLAGFVTATRRLFKKFTGAPPEVRITLPSSELRLFKLHGPLDDRLALQAATWLLFVQAMKAEADLALTIDSTSGTLAAALSLADVMAKTTCLVRTHCAGKANGPAALILASGRRGYRTLSADAVLTLPAIPRPADILGRRFTEALAAATARPGTAVEKDLLRPSAVGPRGAVKMGIADAVGL